MEYKIKSSIMKEPIRKNCCYYNEGEYKEVAFVFSAPGRLELYNGDNKPVVGDTGANLEELIKLLESPKNKLFPESPNISQENKLRINRYKYRITNAYPKPLYRDRDNKSEASNKDIEARGNIKRLYNELKDINQYVILFGNKAGLIEEKLSINAKFIRIRRHLGPQGLNSIKNNELPEGSETNSKKRLKIVRDDIIEQINKSITI